jgi:hypothetical protein
MLARAPAEYQEAAYSDDASTVRHHKARAQSAGAPSLSMMRILLAAVLAVLVPLAACATASETAAPSSSTDASIDGASDATLVCGNADAASMPRCQRGDACHCDDTGTVAPICVAGEWKCAPGTTRWEDCHGVPPIAGCTLDDAGADAADGG